MTTLPPISNPILAVVNIDGLRLRAAPSLSAAIIRELRKGEAAAVSGGGAVVDGYVWLRCDTAAGEQGYAAQYVNGVDAFVSAKPTEGGQAHTPAPIDVPYVSQWDDDAHLSQGDCGIASACMIAHWRGIDTTPDAMITASKLPAGRHSYTVIEVISAARSVGLQLIYQPSSDWPHIREELDAGRPVITLLRYGEISGNLDKFVGAHFWVVIGYDGDTVYVNDPDWWRPHREGGHARHIPLAEFERAIGDALKQTGNQPHQSIFLG